MLKSSFLVEIFSTLFVIIKYIFIYLFIIAAFTLEVKILNIESIL